MTPTYKPSEMKALLIGYYSRYGHKVDISIFDGDYRKEIVNSTLSITASVASALIIIGSESNGTRHTS